MQCAAAANGQKVTFSSYFHVLGSRCGKEGADSGVQQLEGALHVVVGRLVDRAFATQSAIVHFAHSVARQAHALSAANQQLRETRQVRPAPLTCSGQQGS
jgi:hypothetical protein